MGAFGLDDWGAVANEREWPVLLIGNGASRAVAEKFAYDSLYAAAPLTSNDKDLFDALGTCNFEEVLDRLRTAELICTQVGHDANDIRDRYSSIRNALIGAVSTHHVTWQEVNAGDRLFKIRQTLKAHDAVFTTSYDMLIYWAIMNDGSPPGEGFGDLFWNNSHTFDPLDTVPFGDKTLVYWLHGGLHLCREWSGETAKTTSAGANLLDTFASDGRIPLFVSEGTSQQKLRAIRRSDYLEHAYKTFAEAEDDLVVFGQAFGTQDDHLVQAIRKKPGRHVAYGIYPTTLSDTNLQQARIKNLFPDAAVAFFDSKTHPLGDPALLVGGSSGPNPILGSGFSSGRSWRAAGGGSRQ